MNKRFRLKNFRLIYLFKVVTFISWLTVFIDHASLNFRYEYALNQLIISYVTLSVINLLAESLTVYFLMSYSREKIVVNVMSRSGFYLILAFIISGLSIPFLFHNFSTFLFSVGAMIFVVNWFKVLWLKLVFKPKSSSLNYRKNTFNYG